MLKHTNEVQQLLDQLKTEIAAELGITLGADTTARENGSVGGLVTKKLVELGEMKLQEMATQQSSNPYMYQQNQTQPHNELH
jgi:Small, acid-soluble spore proteins, alpha/beta type